jgi:phosphopantothenoylcysteine decarboxylase
MVNILLGVSGSVAAIKLLELVSSLKGRNTNIIIKIVFTPKGKFFVKDADLRTISAEVDAIFTDEQEWLIWERKGDPVLHIELRKWADIFLIVPLSANTMAKLANGLCDNLLTSIVRAWDTSKRLVVCPAMNTFMWENPITSRQLDVIRDVYKAHVILPKDKHLLACGDFGSGALQDICVVVENVLSFVQ